MALFHVVEFCEEAEDGLKGPVAVIPNSWLLAYKDASGRSMCNWPPESVRADSSFIIKNKKPDAFWPIHPVRIHKSFNDYKEASCLCERLKDMSEVESDSQSTPKRQMRVKIAPIRYRNAEVPDTSEAEEEAETLEDDSFVLHKHLPIPPTHSTPFSLPSVASTNSWRAPSSSSTGTQRFLGTPRIDNIPDTFEAKYVRLATRQLALLEELKHDIRTYHGDVKRLLSQKENEGGKGQSGELPQGYDFPLKSSEDVERLDWELKTDPEKRKRLVCYLGMLGGATLKLEVRAILNVLFSTRLARSYNFNGLKGKLGLKSHPCIIQTIQDAARKHYPSATEAEIRSQMSLWLAGARDREYGRKERDQHSLLQSNSGREEHVEDE